MRREVWKVPFRRDGAKQLASADEIGMDGNMVSLKNTEVLK